MNTQPNVISEAKFICQSCGQHLAGSRELQGMQIRCPTCGTWVTVTRRIPTSLRIVVGVVILGIILGSGVWLVKSVARNPGDGTWGLSQQGVTLVSWQVSDRFTSAGETHSITEEAAAKGLTFLIAEATVSENIYQTLTDASENYALGLCHLVMPGDERIRPTIITQRRTKTTDVDLTLVFVVSKNTRYATPPLVVLSDTVKLPLAERTRVK